jgi:AcrR family transcriptional regulator
MPRPSNKSSIVNAALAIAQQGGLNDVTLESVATEAGMTRAGLTYHFPTRTSLIAAIHEQLAQQWEDEMLQELGTPFDEADQMARAVAYVRGTIRIAGQTGWMFINEVDNDPSYDVPWDRVLQRWLPTVTGLPERGPYPDELVRTLVAAMAATGLWAHEAISGQNLPDELRQVLGNMIVNQMLKSAGNES